MRLLLAGLLLLTACGGGSSSATDGGLPDPPEGHRWVGYAGVAVAVTDWWTTGETQCLKPVEDTVYVDTGAITDCAGDEPSRRTLAEVSSLAVMDARSGLGEAYRREMQPLPGHPGILELEGCQRWVVETCRRVFALEGTDVVFAMSLVDAEDGDYELTRDSVRRLPDGMTTVPIAAGRFPRIPVWGDEPSFARTYVKAVEAAGLTPDVTYLDVERGGTGDPASFPRGHLLDVRPQPGTPIEEGGTVEITLMGENPYSEPNR